jgi:hypothetical protein
LSQYGSKQSLYCRCVIDDGSQVADDLIIAEELRQ